MSPTPEGSSSDRALPERVLRIALYHDLPSGGGKRTVEAHVRGLVERGHHVHLFMPSTAEESFLPVARLAQDTTVYPLPEPPNRERALTGRPSPADAVRWLRLLRAVRRAASAAAAEIDRGGFDVALVHPSQFTQAPYVLRWLRTPSLYYCQEPLRAAYEPRITSPLKRLLIRPTLGRVDRRNVRAAGLVVANSGYTRTRIATVYGVDSRVITPGVDPERFTPGSAPRGRYVLAVGALHPLKGFDFLVEALGEIEEDQRPPLILVSDRARRADEERLRILARSSGVELMLRHRVSDRKLAALYAGAAAVVNTGHDEPFGLVPLEAMASGTAVVAVAEGGVSETVVDGETGFLVSRHTHAFADRLAWVLDHPAEAATMGAAGRRLVESRWTWRHALDQLLDALTALASDR